MALRPSPICRLCSSRSFVLEGICDDCVSQHARIKEVARQVYLRFPETRRMAVADIVETLLERRIEALRNG